MRDSTQTRRKFPRVEVEIRLIEITTHDKGVFSGIIKNMSVGGICVLVERELENGVLVEMQITLPDGKPPIECKAQTRWCDVFLRVPKKLHACGFKFLDLSEKDDARLSAFVEPAEQPSEK